MEGMAKGIPATAGAEVIAGLYRDARGSIWGDRGNSAFYLSYFDPDLAPHDAFWKDVARLVDLAFPGDILSQEGLVERQIHQLRYLISSQQAQYVRTHYKKQG